MKKNVFFVAAIFAALCLNSCDKNDPDNPIAGGSGKILLTTALPNATGMDGTVYMQLIDEPVLGKTMATNNNNGINVPFGSSYPMIIGQEVYVFPSYHLTMDKNELIKYRRTNGILQREGSLQLPANNSANNLVKLSSTKAYLSLAGLGLIYIFNPETMQKTGEINLTSLGIQDNKVNDSCGFHVHMDAASFNLDTWKNLALTYKHLEHLIDAFMPRTRRNNTYCKTLSGVSDERIKSVRTIDGLREVFNNDRYHKVNFEAYSRHRTVEFRQHSGTTNFTKMENWIRFLNGLITFAKRSSLPSRMTLEGLPFLDGKQKLFFKLRTKKLAV